MDSFCKIFVNKPQSLKHLAEVVSYPLKFNKKHELHNSINLDTKDLSLSIQRNSDFSTEESKNNPNDFLFFPFYIEVEPSSLKEIYEMNQMEKEAYLEQVFSLVQRLRKENWEVVPACDFEDDLNNL